MGKYIILHHRDPTSGRVFPPLTLAVLNSSEKRWEWCFFGLPKDPGSSPLNHRLILVPVIGGRELYIPLEGIIYLVYKRYILPMG